MPVEVGLAYVNVSNEARCDTIGTSIACGKLENIYSFVWNT